MLKKIRQKIYIHNNIKINLNVIDKKLCEIRKKSDVLAICPSITNYNWMGINIATKNLFPENHFEIPQYYSKSAYSNKELNEIINLIIKYNFNQVIFNGFPLYFEFLIRKLRGKSNNIKLGILFYGYLSELSNNKFNISQMSRIIMLMKENVIDKVGLNKKGLPETLFNITGFKSHYIMVKNPNINFTTTKLDFKGLNIGVLGNNSFRKNIHNQVGAALQIESAQVHVIDSNEFDYFDEKIRTINHGFIKNHNKYLNILSNMDVNLYVSFSESWGLVTTDSLSVGKPCLVSTSGNVYDWDDELKKHLVVHDYDNSNEINKKITFLIEEKPFDNKRLQDYILKLNIIAEDLFSSFLKI